MTRGVEYWILGGEDGHTPVPVPDVMAWARFFEARRANGAEARRVAYTDLFSGGTVSTVFLGIDHSFARFLGGDPDAPPILFETMAFLPDGETDQERYATWDEAEAGHAAMVDKYARRVAASDK